MKKLLVAFAVLCALFLFVSCNPEQEIVKVSAVSLDRTELSMAVGDTDSLTVTVSPSDAADKSVTWKSSNESVATVDQEGKVKAVSVGEAIITVSAVSDPSISANCSVKVNPVAVTAIALNKETTTILVGGEETLTVSFSPENPTDKSITWTSSNEAVATVADGKITAVSVGTATITATSSNSEIKAECAVTVDPVVVTGISLSKTATTILVGGEETLTATVAPENATDKSITWTTSNDAVATVSDGKVTAVGIGTATITATSSNSEIKAECAVTVDPIVVTGISLSKTATTILVGGEDTLTATVTPENATDKSVTWASSHESVATVSDGKVTAVGVGTATITATSSNSEIKAECAVTVNPVVVSGIALNKETTTIICGGEETLTVTISPKNATDKSVTWASSDESVATVSDGKVTAVGVGTATISATSSNTEIKAECAVTVNPVVTFNLKGHGTAIDSQCVALNDKISAPTDPTDAEYDFKGWFIDDACETSYDFNSTVSSNITLYAKWTIKHYTVTFDMGGHGTQIASQEVDHGSKVTAIATPQETGYEFVKWYTDSSLTKEFDIANDTVTSAMTLYAKWRIPVTSIVISGDSSLKMNSGESLVLTATVYPENATNKKFTWSSSNSDAASVDSNGKVKAKSAASAPVTITATSESDPGVTATVTLNLAQTAAVFRMGSGSYKYLTWEELKLEENGTLYGYDASKLSDTEIGEKAFYNTEKLYTLNIPSGINTIANLAFAGAGKGSSINNVYVTIPVTVTSIGGSIFSNSRGVITYEGTSYQWRSIAKSSSWASLLLGSEPIQCTDVCLEVWGGLTTKCYHATHTVNFKTVTFNANGGSGTQSSIYPAYGLCNLPTVDEMTFDSPDAELTFRGWAYSATGSRINSKQIDVTDDITLYAVWAGVGVTNAEELQEAFNLGGTVKLAANIQGNSLVVPAGISVTLDLNGYVFDAEQKGCNIKNNGTLTIIDSNPTAVHTGAYADLPAGGVLYNGLVAEGVGGSIRNYNYATVLKLNGGTIYECTAKGGGAIYNGVVTIDGNVLIKNCHATGTPISGSNYGGGAMYSGTLNFINGTIDSCTAVNSYGGAYSGSSYNPGAGATIRNCSAKYGGALGNSMSSSYSLNGLIENCSAPEAGGAFCGSSFNMGDGAIIKGCTAPIGGAVAILNSKMAQMNISGGLIENCSATERGGAIYYENIETTSSYSSYSITLKNLTIKDCTSGKSGGGVYARVDKSSRINVDNTLVIQNCSAGLAGGSMVKTIVEDLSSMPNISGCKVGGVDNNDIYTGVASAGSTKFVYFITGEEKSMAATNYFTPAEAYNPANIKYSLSSSEYATVDENGVVNPQKTTKVGSVSNTFNLYVTSEIEGISQKIQCQIYDLTLDKDSVSIFENSIGTTTVNYSGSESIYSCTSSDEEVATVSFKSNIISISGHKAGTATITVKQKYSYLTKTIEVTVKPIEAKDILGTHTSEDGTVTRYITSSADFKTALTVNGTIQLLSDIKTYSCSVTASNLTLDLNGYVIDGEEKGRIFGLNNNSNFILMDSNPTRKHESEEYKDLPAGGVLYRGKNASRFSAAGLYLSSGTTATIKGGTFYDCNSTYTYSSSDSTGLAGGAICSNGGTINIEGGSFINCKSEYMGGAITTAGSGVLKVTGGTFKNCDATRYGGAIYVKNGTVSISNAVFSDCDVTSYDGGAIYSSASMTMDNVTISNCSAKQKGGAIYLNGGTLTIKGTSEKPFRIEKCKTTTSTTSNLAGYGGGAIMIAGSNTKVEVKGYATISGCESMGNGGAIYNYGTFTVDGANGGELTISDCSVDSSNYEARAGAIYNYSGTLNLTGTAEHGILISGCKAVGADAGSVYIASGTTSATFDYATIIGKGASEAVAATGGALYVKKAGVVIKNSTFKDCYSTKNGGGIWSSVSLTFENVTISGMKSNACGGGIYARNDKNSVTLSGTTTITGCSAVNGGGIYFNDGNASLTMNDNSVITNCKSSDYGGGVSFSANTSTMTMNDNAKITYCSSNRGGGINLFGTLTMNGNSKITNCDALKNGNTNSYGAAVIVRENSTMKMTGNSQVTDNRCQSYGSAIQVDNNSKLIVQDAVQVKNNKRVDNSNVETVVSDVNIRLNDEAGKIIVNAALSGDAYLGISTTTAVTNAREIATGNTTDNAIPTGAEAFFHADIGPELEIVLAGANSITIRPVVSD